MPEHVEGDAPRECGWCGKTALIVYVDVLGMPWCATCYEDTFSADGAADHQWQVTTPPEVYASDDEPGEDIHDYY